MIEPPVCVPKATGTMKSATAAADPLDDPPGVCAGWCGFAVGPGMAQREFRGDRLAQHDGAGLARQRHACRVGGRPVTGMNRRAVARRHVVGVDDVLHAEGQPVERSSRSRLARSRAARFRERALRIEKGKRAHDRIALGDALEAGARQRLGGKAARRPSPPALRWRPARSGPAPSEILLVAMQYAEPDGAPCDRAYPVLPIADNFAVANVATATSGGVPDHGSQSTWHQRRDGSGRAGDRPGRAVDRARAIGAAPRAAGGSQDPGHRPDDEQHHQQSRLHDLRHAVLAGQQAHAEAADGRELHEERRRPHLDVQAPRPDSSSTMASR